MFIICRHKIQTYRKKIEKTFKLQKSVYSAQVATNTVYRIKIRLVEKSLKLSKWLDRKKHVSRKNGFFDKLLIKNIQNDILYRKKTGNVTGIL